MKTNNFLGAVGISTHEDPDLGIFFQGLGGFWRLASKADFPFQNDVDLIFDAIATSEVLPVHMPANVTWINNHLAEVWNAAAAALNAMPELAELEMPDGFALDGIFINLPDQKIEETEWSMSMNLKDQQVSLQIKFRGLEIVGHSFDHA